MSKLRDLTPKQLRIAKNNGLPVSTVRQRLEIYNYSIEDAITKPSKRKAKKGAKLFIRISEEIKEKLANQAKSEDITLVEVVRDILDLYYRKKKTTK